MNKQTMAMNIRLAKACNLLHEGSDSMERDSKDTEIEFLRMIYNQQAAAYDGMYREYLAYQANAAKEIQRLTEQLAQNEAGVMD